MNNIKISILSSHSTFMCIFVLAHIIHKASHLFLSSELQQ